MPLALGLAATCLLTSACTEAPADVALSPEAQRGREVFLYQSTPSCGTCHVLRHAGTRGALGPDLDELQADYDRVLRAVTEGVALMPPQKGVLSPQQMVDVSRYVVEATASAEAVPPR